MFARSRTLLAALGTACFAAAFASTPAEVRSRGSEPFVLPAPRVSAPDVAPIVMPQVDPFVPRADDATPAARLPPATVVDPVLPPGIIALPPNAGALAHPVGFGVDEPQLSAIALGAHPSAVIAFGGSVHLVTVGEGIAGATVVAIDAHGVRLSDHRRLAFAAAEALK